MTCFLMPYFEMSWDEDVDMFPAELWRCEKKKGMRFWRWSGARSRTDMELTLRTRVFLDAFSSSPSPPSTITKACSRTVDILVPSLTKTASIAVPTLAMFHRTALPTRTTAITNSLGCCRVYEVHVKICTARLLSNVATMERDLLSFLD